MCHIRMCVCVCVCALARHSQDTLHVCGMYVCDHNVSHFGVKELGKGRKEGRNVVYSVISNDKS